VVLLLLPHAVGAPGTEAEAGAVPAELARRFAVAALAVSALFWLVLGGVAGWAFKRLG